MGLTECGARYTYQDVVERRHVAYDGRLCPVCHGSYVMEFLNPQANQALVERQRMERIAEQERDAKARRKQWAVPGKDKHK